MALFSRPFSAILAAAGILAACQTTQTDVPAVLVSNDAEALTKVKTVLADALGQASLELGPAEDSSVLSVLPPKPGPLETHSTAMPTYFDLILRGDACYAVERESGTAYLLDGVACTPLG